MSSKSPIQQITSLGISASYEKAIDRVRAILEIDPKNPFARMVLADVYARVGQTEEAMDL